MRSKPIDPAVQALLDEAGQLPDCAARNTLFERAAHAAEALRDMDAAWDARCRLLSSVALMASARHEMLFVNLSWCLAVSDREPERFDVSQVLWQYKWVVEQAPLYAKIPKSVIFRLLEDMDERFRRGRWGARAGLHKRFGVLYLIGEMEQARAIIDPWRATQRDRGADCRACEMTSVAEFYAELGEHADAVREAAPILRGRLSCATVPHCTYGRLLVSLECLGRAAEANSCFQKGRRLIAEMSDYGSNLAAPYMSFAARTNQVEAATLLLRARFRALTQLQSDYERARVFGDVWRTLTHLSNAGVEEIDLPAAPGWIEAGFTSTSTLAERCRITAFAHAALLDQRNGNDQQQRWLNALP